jgi:hypothetical protein
MGRYILHNSSKKVKEIKEKNDDNHGSEGNGH